MTTTTITTTDHHQPSQKCGHSVTSPNPMRERRCLCNWPPCHQRGIKLCTCCQCHHHRHHHHNPNSQHHRRRRRRRRRRRHYQRIKRAHHVIHLADYLHRQPNDGLTTSMNDLLVSIEDLSLHRVFIFPSALYFLLCPWFFFLPFRHSYILFLSYIPQYLVHPIPSPNTATNEFCSVQNEFVSVSSPKM